ncbi:MAG TPA: FIST C-terminal domain-containing protein, partial [Flavobacteriales bacterium]|nr:FIST C-terminal domain-containing protein [Flavobacteriales bacterium]
VLLFPLSLRIDGSPNMLVRTITSLNEENDSMTFAGDMPVGSRVRMMTTDVDKLVNAAAEAARDAAETFHSKAPELTLIVSCIGRKMILKGRCEEEVAAVRRIVGPDASIAGFYSYGELSPFKGANHCDLHNQSMTITTLSES